MKKIKIPIYQIFSFSINDVFNGLETFLYEKGINRNDLRISVLNSMQRLNFLKKSSYDFSKEWQHVIVTDLVFKNNENDFNKSRKSDLYQFLTNFILADNTGGKILFYITNQEREELLSFKQEVKSHLIEIRKTHNFITKIEFLDDKIIQSETTEFVKILLDNFYKNKKSA